MCIHSTGERRACARSTGRIGDVRGGAGRRRRPPPYRALEVPDQPPPVSVLGLGNPVELNLLINSLGYHDFFNV
jgi:hypothetical protein